jgi:hypothetical protein
MGCGLKFGNLDYWRGWIKQEEISYGIGREDWMIEKNCLIDFFFFFFFRNIWGYLNKNMKWMYFFF